MKIYFLYFSSEIVKSFFLGVVVFVSLILVTQFLQLSEFILIHDVSFFETLSILGFMCVSFLPIVMPMSLLFSILMTYSRLASDSEIIALSSFGYPLRKLAWPALFFSLVISIVSLQILFSVGPIARLKFDTSIQKIGSQKILAAIHEKTFIEDFFGMVIYFNEKGTNNEMRDIFIKDLRVKSRPVTIIAKLGSIVVEKDDLNQTARIDLSDGYMINEGLEKSLTLKFDKYSLRFLSPMKTHYDERDFNTYTFGELCKMLQITKNGDPYSKLFTIEMYRRFALGIGCIIFGFLGVALGISVNRRSASSKGFILSVLCLTMYWVLTAGCLTLAEKANGSIWLIVLAPDICFFIYTLILWKRMVANR